MTQLEKVKLAKEYMDKLANGINPITDMEILDDSVINDVKISRFFNYVSGILSEVIDNDGVVKKIPSKDKVAFFLSEEQKNNMRFSDQPLTISVFAEMVNHLVDVNSCKKIKPTDFTEWLVLKEFLTVETENGSKRKEVSELGKSIGIIKEFRNTSRGVFSVILYDKNAQEFLFDNIDEIINFSK